MGKLPNASIIYISLPGIKEEVISNIFEFVLRDDIFNYDLAKMFFETASIHYLDFVLNFFYKLSIGKQPVIIQQNKTKTLIKCILTVLPTIIKGKELPSATQTLIYNILYVTIPAKIKKLKMEINNLNQIFNQLKDVDPTNEQRMFLIPFFPKQYYIIFRNEPQNKQLAVQLVDNFVSQEDFSSLDEETIDNFANLIVNLSPEEDTVLYAIKSLKCNFSESIINNLIFVQKFSKRGNEHQLYGFETKYIHVFIQLVLCTTNKLESMRYFSIQALSSLYDIKTETNVLNTITKEQIYSNMHSLFQQISCKLSGNFVHLLFEKLLQKRLYNQSTGILIRSILNSRKDLSDFSKSVLELFLDYEFMTNDFQYEFETGFYEYFVNSPMTALRIILLSEAKFKQTAIEILLNSNNRKTFIDKLLIYFNKSSNFEQTRLFFPCLNTIIETENSLFLSPYTFSSVFICILQWIGSYEKESTTDEITNCISNMFSKTTLKEKVNCIINLKDNTSLSDSICNFCKYLIKLAPINIKDTLNRSLLLLGSVNTTYKKVGGFFIIHLSKILVNYGSEDLSEIRKSSFYNIGNVFSSYEEGVRVFSLILETTLSDSDYKIFTYEIILVMYNLILSSLLKDSELYKYNTSKLLCKLLPFIKIEDLNVEVLYKVLKKLFDDLPYCKFLFDGLKYYLEAKSDISEFLGKDNFSIYGFCSVISKDIDGIIDIIIKIVHSEQIVQELSKNFENNELIEMGLIIINNIKEIKSKHLINFFNNLIIKLGDLRTINIQSLKKSLMLKVIPICNEKENELNQDAIKLLQILIK